MKAFIWKCALVCLGILFAIHFTCIITNDKDEFCAKYTDIEIVNHIPKQYIEWRGTNSYNGKVETIKAEYCKKCGDHLRNVDYDIEDLKSGTITPSPLSSNATVSASTLISKLPWLAYIALLTILCDDVSTDETPPSVVGSAVHDAKATAAKANNKNLTLVIIYLLLVLYRLAKKHNSKVLN